MEGGARGNSLGSRRGGVRQTHLARARAELIRAPMVCVVPGRSEVRVPAGTGARMRVAMSLLFSFLTLCAKSVPFFYFFLFASVCTEYHHDLSTRPQTVNLGNRTPVLWCK